MRRERQKEPTSHYRTLDVRKLKCSGALADWRGGWEWKQDGRVVASISIEGSREQVRLRYRSSSRGGKDPVEHDYPVPITWTPCHLGGERPWFLCPCCGRRVAKLYGATVFACRHCLRLNYPSQQANKYDRALSRARTLRRRLGNDAGPLDYPAEYIQRPKGMHHATFARHIERLERVEAQAIADYNALVAYFERRCSSAIEALSPYPWNASTIPPQVDGD